MTRNPILLSLLLCSCAPPPDVGTADRARRSDSVDASRFSDKVTAGYQGWFSAPGDVGPTRRWMHWAPGVTPSAGHVTFELYPDTREYPDDALFPTGLGALGDGRPARLYGAASPAVVDAHFRWMEDSGIDGVGLQRFVSELGDPVMREFRNTVARNVRAAAESHGRIFYLEYDISGANPASWVDDLERDFADVLDGELHVTDSPRYAREDGRPVVVVWGPGFPDRPGTPEQTAAVAAWLHARGLYIVVGVPYHWRTGEGAKPGFLDAWTRFDMIQPWSVGAYSTDEDLQANYDRIIIPDRDFAKAHGVAYQRVIFPGFAWSNWNGNRPNLIPRRAGALLWHQAWDVRRAGLTAFIAMFDEFDEGTAIAKAAEDRSMIPSDQYFLTLDADGTRVSSDFYLRLAGAATRMIEGQAPLTRDVPIPPNASAPPPTPMPPPDNPPQTEPVVPRQHAAPPAMVRGFSAPAAAAIVGRLYRGLLGRDPDPSGAGAYQPLVESGRLPEVTSALATSAEFDQRRPSLTARDLATDLYESLLDRAIDPSGLATTVDAIAGGDVARRTADIILSPEFAQKNP